MDSPTPNTSPTAVIIGFVWPEPDSSAAGQNMMGIISSFLRANWQVVFMTAANPSDQCADLALDGLCVESIALNCSSFDKRIAEINPSVVVFDRFMTEEQFSARVYQACPQAMRVLNTEDLHSVRLARHQQLKNNDSLSPPSRPLTDDTGLREIAAILRSDLTLILSQPEMSYLRDICGVPASQLCYLPLLTNSETVFSPAFNQRHDFIFIGNFRHAPNWDAVLQLEQLWPGIKKRLPDAQLNIFGAYPPKKAMAMHRPEKGFHVKGWAMSAETEIAQHRVMLAPIRFGAGVKGKLVKAMQCSTPSVTTSLGAEGITSENNWPGIVTHNQQDFIDAAVALYTDEDMWNKHAKHGQCLFSQQFDEETNHARLMASITTQLAGLADKRQLWLLQNMLWHQTLRASQYMSQWIEAKNKHSATPPKAW